MTMPRTSVRSSARLQPASMQAWLATVLSFDFIAILLVMAAFVMAVMDEKLPYSKAFGKLKWFVYVAFVGFAALRHLQSTIRERPFAGAIGRSLALFVLATSIITISFSVNVDEGFQRSISFLLLYLIAFVFVMPGGPWRRLAVWTNAVFVISAVLVLLSVWHLRSGTGFTQGRLRGAASNANTMGTYAAMFLVAAFCMFLLLRDWRRWLAAAGVLAAGSTLILSQSRSALGAAVAAIFAVLLLRRRFGMMLLVAVFAVCFVKLPGFRYSLFRSLDPPVTVEDRDYTDVGARFPVWQKQFESWLKSPVLGHGLEVRYEEREGRPLGECSYLDMLASTGIVGTAPFLFGLFGALWGLYRRMRLDPTLVIRQPCLLPAFGICVQIAVNSIGEGYLVAVGCSQAIYVWVVMGVAAGLETSPGVLNQTAGQSRDRQEPVWQSAP